MSTTINTSVRGSGQDHFQPDGALDPQEQRRLRGHLEQIDFAAYAANVELLTRMVGPADIGKFQKLAVAAAQARAEWVAAALAMTSAGHSPPPADVQRLSALRLAYEELTGVYEAMRRMVERGYLKFAVKP